MADIFRVLLGIVSSVVTGFVGSYAASRFDRYIARRTKEKSSNPPR